MSDLQEVTKQLLTRCEELEARLYDTERAAKQLQSTLSEQIEENYRLTGALDEERAAALQLRQKLTENEDTIEALQSDLQVATETSASIKASTSAAHSGVGDQTARDSAATPRVAGKMVEKTIQTLPDMKHEEEVGKLEDKIKELEKQLNEYEEEMNKVTSPLQPPDDTNDTTFGAAAKAGPNPAIPALKIGKGAGGLDSSTSNLNTDRFFGKGLSQRNAGEQPIMGLVAATPRTFAVAATPRGIPIALVSQTPRLGAAGVSDVNKLLADAQKNPQAYAKLLDTLAQSNIDLMTTPRAFVPTSTPTKIPPLALGGKAPPPAKDIAIPTSAQPTDLTRALGLEAAVPKPPPSTRTAKYKLQLRADGCPTCNLVHDAEQAYPRSKLNDRRQYAGAGWIPDVCMRWAQDHAFIWTNEERMIMQRVIEKKPQLKLFPVSQQEGPIHVYRRSILPNFIVASWQSRFAVLHGVFLYIFPQRQPDATLLAAIPIRNATLTHCTLEGKANCLVIESLGCSTCAGDPDHKFGIEKMIIAMPTPVAAEQWTTKLVEAQRTCPHECSSVFSDVHMLRDLIEDLTDGSRM